MGLLQRIVGGGLQGLGAGMVRQTEHQRQLDGIKLRQSYYDKRQEALLKAQGEQR